MIRLDQSREPNRYRKRGMFLARPMGVNYQRFTFGDRIWVKSQGIIIFLSKIRFSKRFRKKFKIKKLNINPSESINSHGPQQKTYLSFGTDLAHVIDLTESFITGNENGWFQTLFLRILKSLDFEISTGSSDSQ